MPEPAQTGPAAVQAAVDQGLTLHRAGRLDEAKSHYILALEVDPGHFDALHMLGVLCIQTGQLAFGAELIEQAVAVRPDEPAALANLANALNGLKRHDEALARADRAIGLKPDYAEAHGNRGLALHQLGRTEEALSSYERLATLRPADARPRFNRAVMLRELGRLNDALTSLDEAIALTPDYAEAHRSRGVTLHELGRSDMALASCEAALALRPDYAEAWYDKGNALLALQRPLDAMASFDEATARRPAYAEAWSNRGNALNALKRHEEALASYDQAIALKPDHAEAHSNRMIPLRELKRPDQALATCDRAIALKPDYAEAYNNRGGALYEFRRLDEGLADCDQAIALKPDFAEAYDNRAVTLYELRRFEESLADSARAVALKPDYAEAQYSMALCRLMLGDYAQGWAQYEWRWKTGQFREMARDLAAPLWLGREPLQGRTILLHGEQGLGDTLQFSRYASRVAALGAKVVLEVQGGLERLLSRLEGVDRVLTRGEALPPHDFQTPLLSLPLALNAGPEGELCPYLIADPADSVRWATRLATGEDLRVGLCWAGGTRPDQPIAHAIDKRRSLALAALAPLADVSGLALYSLQKGPPAAELAGWNGPAIIDLTAELKDFADTAALVANLDLVITCDTSTAHLAGGMGVPVWVLNRHDACWRWLDGRADSPWYPSARLFRQSAPGDWDSVIAEVTAELLALASRSRPARSA
jgi:tetratricopeptide (TPR) repeat protein